MPSRKETILVMSAHTDDFVIGAGGTIAQYVNEGKRVISVVFSLGEKSHPWLKESVVQKFRAEETLRAGRVLKSDIIFFGLRDQMIIEEYKTKKIEPKLLKLIAETKPTKIFTHSNEDPHSDHKAVHRFTMEVLEKVKQKPEVYIYSIWNPVSFKTLYPILYVDIGSTFAVKMAALREF